MNFLGKLRRFWAFIKSSPSRITIAICLVIVLVFSLGFIAYAASYTKIMPNTWIADVCIGKLSKEEASSTIIKHFAKPLEDREITLRCQNRENSVSFNDLGISADVGKTVENAFNIGRHYGAFSKTAMVVKSFFVRTTLPLSVTSDMSKIDKAVSNLAKGYETDATDTSYVIENDILTITKGIRGKKVDRENTLSLLSAAAEDESILVLNLELEDAEPTAIDVDKLYNKLSAPEKDAYYKYENGKVSVVDEKISVIVDKSEFEKAFLSSDKTCSIPVKTIHPKKTAEELSRLLFCDTLASYSSSFSTSSESRATNVRLSASRINDYILMPGDVFSYDKTIGKRTAANGFREANVYVGNKIETGIGGGICQTSSTLYSAALYANLEIVSRTSHSLPVGYVPAGQDATIAEGYIDLLIKNNTEYPIKIVSVTNGRMLTCKILGVKTPGQSVELFHTRVSTSNPKLERSFDEALPVGYKKTTNSGAEGYTIASKRIVKINGEIIKSETLPKSVYNAASIEETVNPADKDTPSESLIEYSEEAFNESQPQIPEDSEPLPEDGGFPMQQPEDDIEASAESPSEELVEI